MCTLSAKVQKQTEWAAKKKWEGRTRTSARSWFGCSWSLTCAKCLLTLIIKGNGTWVFSHLSYLIAVGEDAISHLHTDNTFVCLSLNLHWLPCKDTISSFKTRSNELENTYYSGFVSLGLFVVWMTLQEAMHWKVKLATGLVWCIICMKLNKAFVRR